MEKKIVQKNFDYYIDEYLYYCRSRRLRKKTMQSYEQTLRLFERWAREDEEITAPGEVTERTIRKYICNLEERGKYSFYADEEQVKANCPQRRRDYRQQVSVTTINNYLRNLRAFFNWYCEEHSGKKSPMKKVRLLANERKPKEYLEDDEVKKLMSCFDKSYFSEHRDAAIIMLLLDTGMRLGECLAIKMEALNMNERAIFLPADTTKGRKERYVFFSARTARSLQSWLRFKDRYVETDVLFPVKATGQPVSVGTFESNFRGYIQRAGITKQVSPHALRNNFAKRCILAGMDIYTLSRILRHSSVTITEKAYLDLTDQDVRRCYQRFSPVENLR